MFTNADIKEYRDILFAHGPAYFSPDIVARREREKEEIIQSLVGLPEGSIAVLSEIQGSGKTFVLKSVSGHLINNKLVNPDEKVLFTIVEFDEKLLSAKRLNTLLILDEMDKKHREKVKRILTVVNLHLGANVRNIVLSGDRILRDQDLLEMLPRGYPIKFIEMEPLTKEFFLEALVKRAKREPGLSLRADHIGEVFDKELLRYLIPNIDPAVTPFREIFSALTTMVKSEALPLDENPCLISGDVCREWFLISPAPEYSPAQIAFLEWLRDHIKTSDGSGTKVRPLTTPECKRLCSITGIANEEEYENDVLLPLVRAGILRGLGIPFRDGTGTPKRDPGPYLPTVWAFLRTFYDEYWPK